MSQHACDLHLVIPCADSDEYSVTKTKIDMINANIYGNAYTVVGDEGAMTITVTRSDHPVTIGPAS